MAQFELADAQTVAQSEATGLEVDPKAELDFAPDDRMAAAYNPDDGALYIFIVRVSDTTLHVYRSRSYLRNEWTQVSPDGGHSVANASNPRIGYPLVTEDNTVLVGIGELNDSSAVYRTADWGETVDEVATGWAPLYTRYAQDNNGDIYFGEYFPHPGSGGNTASVWKSTDDGQTWTELAQTSADDHIHGVTAAPESNLLVVQWGDTNGVFEFADKNWTNNQVLNANGPTGANDYVAVPAIPLPGQATGDELTFLTGNDTSTVNAKRLVTRGHVEDLGDGTFDYTHYYTVPATEYQRDSPFISDILKTAGRYVALGHHGYLMVSDDGWFWDRISIPLSPINEFEMHFAETPRHLVCAAQTLTIIPKDDIATVSPQSVTYSFHESNLENAFSSGDSVYEVLPIHKTDELKLIGGYDAGDSIRINEFASMGASGSRPADVERTTLLDWGANGTGTLSATHEPVGATAQLQYVGGNGTTNLNLTLNLKRK